MATISIPSRMILQLTAAELKTSDEVGCRFIARNAGVSSSVGRSTKMKGMIRQRKKKGKKKAANEKRNPPAPGGDGVGAHGFAERKAYDRGREDRDLLARRLE